MCGCNKKMQMQMRRKLNIRMHKPVQNNIVISTISPSILPLSKPLSKPLIKLSASLKSRD